MKSCLYCGISISGEGLRYVELQKEGTSVRCSSRAKVYLSKNTIFTESVVDVDFLYAALKKLRRKIGRFGKVRAAFGIPLRDSFACFMDFPSDMIFDDVKKSLRWQLEERFPLSGEEAYYDAAEVDFPYGGNLYEKGTLKKYLVVASGKSFVDKIMKVATRAGFFPTALEPVSVALFRSAFAHVKNKDGNSAIFDMSGDEWQLFFFPGESMSLIALGYRGSEIFFRPVMVGRQMTFEDLVQNAVREISFTVDYLNGCYPHIEIGKLFLVSSAKTDLRLLDALRPALAFHVILLDPWEAFPSHERPKGKGWEASLGLALRDIV